FPCAAICPTATPRDSHFLLSVRRVGSLPASVSPSLKSSATSKRYHDLQISRFGGGRYCRGAACLSIGEENSVNCAPLQLSEKFAHVHRASPGVLMGVNIFSTSASARAEFNRPP